MKKIIFIILITVFLAPVMVHAQLLDQDKEIYQHKVMSFTRMKHTGIWLTIGGALLTAGGIALMVDGERGENSNYVYTDEYGNPYVNNDKTETGAGAKILLGTLTACVGIMATSGGVVLWTIGGSKARSYRGKLNSLSFNYNPGPRQLFSLAYRF